jgi:hypothetical protein
LRDDDGNAFGHKADFRFQISDFGFVWSLVLGHWSFAIHSSVP